MSNKDAVISYYRVLVVHNIIFYSVCHLFCSKYEACAGIPV